MGGDDQIGDMVLFAQRAPTRIARLRKQWFASGLPHYLAHPVDESQVFPLKAHGCRSRLVGGGIGLNIIDMCTVSSEHYCPLLPDN